MNSYRALFAALSLAVAATLATGPAPVGAASDGSPKKDDRVAFLLAPGADGAAIAADLKAAGWKVTRDRAGERVRTASPTGAASASVSDVLTLLRGKGGITAADYDGTLSLKSPFGGGQSEAPIFMSDLDKAQMCAQPSLDLIRGRLPAPPTPPAPVLVAVIDGGFLADHEALEGAYGPGYDAIDMDGIWEDCGNLIDEDGDGVVDAGVGHGTAVASLVRLVCPSAIILPVRALNDEGYGTDAAFAAGLDWAVAAGARVVNVSAGRSAGSALFDASLAAARAAGVVVICSAGNGGQGNVWYPARSGTALAISGCRLDSMPESTSTNGEAVDLAAPAVQVIAAHPNGRTAYAYWSGTSFSSALVSGGLARVACERCLTGPQLLTLLTERLTAWPADATGAWMYGDGILSVEAMLR